MSLQIEDITLHVLQTIGNPVRMSIIRSLSSRKKPTSYSELMWSCGLNPNFDSGRFSYHLSELITGNVLRKSRNTYVLSDFGLKLSNILRMLDKESKLFLSRQAIEKSDVEKTVGFQVKWAKEEDYEKYGITHELSEEFKRLPKEEVEKAHKFEFPGEFLVALKDDEVLGWIEISSALRADLKEKRLTLPVTTIADIKATVIHVAGDHRASVARQLIETFLEEACKRGAMVANVNVCADEEQLVQVFKTLGFQRETITYKMSRKLT